MEQIDSNDAEAWRTKVRRVDVALHAMLAEQATAKKKDKQKAAKPSRFGPLMFPKDQAPQPLP